MDVALRCGDVRLILGRLIDNRVDIGCVSGRSKYGVWLMSGLAIFGLLSFLASRALVHLKPSTEHLHYEPVTIDEKEFYTGFASEGEIPRRYVNTICISNPYELKQTWAHIFDYGRAIDGAYKIVLKHTLPAASYIVEVRCEESRLVLPMFQKGPDLYVSEAFIPLNVNDPVAYTQSIRALECQAGHEITYTLEKIIIDP